MTPDALPVVDLRFGDCLAVLRDLPDASVHAVICDPPYGLADIRPAQVTAALTAWANGDREHVPNGRGFMGRSWDAFVPPPAVWDECLRVLTPGGHLAAFAGSRTYDLMGVSIRMAGFEIRDGLQWLMGSGMPKGRDLGKDSAQWSGWNTSLKPAHEPIVLARKPLSGTVAATVLAHGTGALHVDACRTAHASAADLATSQAKDAHASFGSGPRKLGDTYQGQPAGDRAQYDGTAGRWPANVLLDEGAAAELDEQSAGTRASKPAKSGSAGKAGEIYNSPAGSAPVDRGDEPGGASRFYPTFRYQAKAPASERPKIDGKGWPTVKPQGVMRWLVRLLTPPGGTVLDPFGGTGSTGQAAQAEGFASIVIERDEFAYRLACTRLGLSDPGEGFSAAPAEPAPVVDITPAPEPEPIDPILAALEEAATPADLVVVWRAHKASWTEAYTARAAELRARLEGAA